MTRIYQTSTDLVNHINEQAATLVRKVNPGRDYTQPWFAAKVAEVADAMARKLCRDNTAAGRPAIARAVRTAWEANQQ